jgi:hypothetical protein
MMIREWVMMYSPVDFFIRIPCSFGAELENTPVLSMLGVKVLY